MPSQSCWRSTYREWREDEAKPLGLTVAKSHQGVCGVAQFATGWYPACSEHGAMNRVAEAQLWRCLQCNIGVELLVVDRCPGCERPMDAATCPRCTGRVEELAAAVHASAGGRATFPECYEFAKAVAAREAGEIAHGLAIEEAFRAA